MTLAEAPAVQPESFTVRVREVIRRLAYQMEKEILPAGDRAALRRESQGPAFWKIAVRDLEPNGLLAGGEEREESLRRWAAILAIVARAPELQTNGRRLGTALAEADIVEARVLRLAQAAGETLRRTARAVAQQLASLGQRVDWSDFAELILSDERPWAEDVRHRICLDFYRSTDRAARDSKKES